MALKLRKDIKKSSYYVWFLGAKESKGLRGSEFILPVIKHLEQREKDIEPFKVTLQVSHKGLKIVQNVLSQNKSSKPKNETIKHFIPHNTITCVYQHEDIIACILLLFNPVTKCPLHVHAYRCDSLETATLLRQQLQVLIERPENQKKFQEIENRLKPAIPVETKQKIKKVESSLGSDTGTSTRESESSEERFTVENSRVSTLYDSVAAELREKLNKNKVPILLPPRDYDTVHRQKGNLTGIELRRCLNANIVGQNVKGRRIESSGGSSGIGSDHPPSPESPDAPDSRFNTLDNHSTSDEDWNGDPAETTLYLMHHGNPQVTLPRPIREESPPSPRYNSNSSNSNKPKPSTRNITKYLEKPIAKYAENQYIERQKSIDRQKARYFDEDDDCYKRDSNRRYEKELNKPVKYFDDDGFDEGTRYRNDYDDEPFYPKYQDPPIPKARQRHRQRTPSPPASPRDRFKDAKEKFLLMEKERLEQLRSNNSRASIPEPPISPTISSKEKPFLKRHESLMCPKPAPRHLHDDVHYRHRDRDVPLERYRNDKYDPKRRSMFNLIEEEHRKNSNEIAKELKRRSYMEDFSKSSVELDQIGEIKYRAERKNKSNVAGYRHSYAEPKLRLDAKNGAKKGYPDVLHRTNSVSNNNNGRVGIASVHPY